jgi:DNA-binding NarL/FixJ family response regulator
VRAVVADDSVLLREGIVALLTDHGIDVVGQAGTADELLDLVRRDVPDVAIVDIRMPPGQRDEGLVAARSIRSEFGDRIGILVLSQYDDPDYAIRILNEGRHGVGYLLKDRVRDVDEFVEAVQRVAGGGFVVDPQVVGRLVDRIDVGDDLATLTDRERDVLALMGEGRSNQAIAGVLGLAPKTVETYVGTIFSKLGLEPEAAASRRVLAVLTWLRSRSLARGSHWRGHNPQ